MDTLFYNADNPRERYDAQRTLRRQNNAYLTHGSVLYSNLGNPLLTIVADTCGRHDTSAAPARRRATPCVMLSINVICTAAGITFCACLHDGRLQKRDIAANINFFMNVPVTPQGGLTLRTVSPRRGNMSSCAPSATSSC